MTCTNCLVQTLNSCQALIVHPPTNLLPELIKKSNIPIYQIYFLCSLLYTYCIIIREREQELLSQIILKGTVCLRVNGTLRSSHSHSASPRKQSSIQFSLSAKKADCKTSSMQQMCQVTDFSFTKDLLNISSAPLCQDMKGCNRHRWHTPQRIFGIFAQVTIIEIVQMEII